MTGGRINLVGFLVFISWFVLAGFVSFGTSANELVACNNDISCARNSVVSVLPVWPNPASRKEEPEGSGIVVGQGKLVATADHVLGSASRVFIRTAFGEVLEAEIAFRDPQTDIALLKIARSLPPFRLETKTALGSRVCAIGNAFGLDISITCGVLSAQNLSGVGFNTIEDFIQTDAAVNPGMSGGALVNSDGALIGLLSAIFTKKSDSNIGVNFSVSVALLRRVVEDFADDGKLARIRPGVLLKPSTKPGQTGIAGARIARVADDGAEQRAGLVTGDIILFAGKRRIKRAGAYTAALALLAKGDSLDLEIIRDGKRQSVTVRYE